MFAYCLDNPIIMSDSTGEIAVTTLIFVCSVVAGVLVAGHTAYTSYEYTGSVDWANAILSGLSAFSFCYTYGMSAYSMYLSYCQYKGYTPITNIGGNNYNSTPPTKNNAPYSHLEDPENVGPGKDFTAKQRQVIIEENMKQNNGTVLSDSSKGILSQPEKSMKGVTPSPDEWQIDHIIPKKAGGTNGYSNAQVLSRFENRLKWDKE